MDTNSDKIEQVAKLIEPLWDKDRYATIAIKASALIKAEEIAAIFQPAEAQQVPELRLTHEEIDEVRVNTEYTPETPIRQQFRDMHAAADAATDKAVRFLEAKHGFELDMIAIACSFQNEQWIRATWQSISETTAEKQAMVAEIVKEFPLIIPQEYMETWNEYKFRKQQITARWHDFKVKWGLK